MTKRKETTPIKNPQLGRFIKSRRESRGITKADASRRSGLDYSYWVKLEAGIYEMPSPIALDLVADVIGCKEADLYALAGYKIGGDLPGFGPYLRSKYRYLPPEAIDQLEGYFALLRNYYGIPDDEPVFPPKDRQDLESDDRSAA